MAGVDHCDPPRERRRQQSGSTGFVVGDSSILISILNECRFLDVRVTVVLAQPGLSRVAMTNPVAEVLVRRAVPDRVLQFSAFGSCGFEPRPGHRMGPAKWANLRITGARREDVVHAKVHRIFRPAEIRHRLRERAVGSPIVVLGHDHWRLSEGSVRNFCVMSVEIFDAQVSAVTHELAALRAMLEVQCPL
jgi:hypothetical protein